MRKTIHLCQREIQPLKCYACGEIAEVGLSPPGNRIAICYNRSDWETIYINHNEYRRCIDPPDQRDRTRTKFPTPTEVGYYWALWQIAEDGTYPDGHEHILTNKPEVVEVTTDIDGEFAVDVPGYARPQALENFVWLSDKLEPPK